MSSSEPARVRLSWRRSDGCKSDANWICATETLGLTQSTLSRWIREAPGAESAFHEVAIVSAMHDQAKLPTAPPPLRLLTPHGFVVEGLDPELLVSLLQVLG